MAQRRKKKKRRGSSTGGKGGSSGTIGSFRGGMKRVVGQGPKRKETTFSRILTYVLLIAALGLLAYRLLNR
ncbi:MAG: hypothetical protein CSA65_09870 [Proteobacteria bacterium]|nr:MAG: hypothetical protein CSB49_08670 [Pseudomonadota bacterium]PIE17023.1 MAG: hypothetical protein CSA65_09870 [Pseudomonadota bacterium]